MDEFRPEMGNEYSNDEDSGLLNDTDESSGVLSDNEFDIVEVVGIMNDGVYDIVDFMGFFRFDDDNEVPGEVRGKQDVEVFGLLNDGQGMDEDTGILRDVG